ncbi:MAG TPA: undecaprenyl-phosphate glucose phosphotransferase, partial [Usitatibacter sp.]|nr:undecaprenyl-phosphate glucose phosphotransferase [Usitatibacter sp.]
MIATQESHLKLGQGPLTLAVLVRMLAEPVLAISTLAASGMFFGEPFHGPYIILSLLVFSLTFPGSAPRGTSPGAIARDVLAGWALIVALLLLLGWATRTMGSFDERVLVMWVAITPPVLFAAHMLTPVLLPRIVAAEGLRRKAVVAGGGILARKLAERIQATQFLGVEVAGFFDDRAAGRMPYIRTSPVLGKLSQLAEYAKKNRVDLIYLALPMASQPRIMRLLDELHDTTASIYFTPDIFLFDLIQ